LKDQLGEATRLAEWFARVFGPDFYVEIQNNGLDIQRQCAQGAIAIANRLGVPLVATCDAHYLCRQDAPAHDVLLCINPRKTRRRRRPATGWSTSWASSAGWASPAISSSSGISSTSPWGTASPAAPAARAAARSSATS